MLSRQGKTFHGILNNRESAATQQGPIPKSDWNPERSWRGVAISVGTFSINLKRIDASRQIPLIGSRDPRRILSGFYQDSLLIKSPKTLLILSGRRHLGRHLGRRRSNFRSITAEGFLQSTREISRPYCSQQDRCLFDVDERLCSERMCSERLCPICRRLPSNLFSFIHFFPQYSGHLGVGFVC